ncbi:hypothetical protein FJY63_10295 [Candidatus Sumerlaeota bacterium]|nr:hypothetical protein [Candidatus Sumerlaeota bacterium]
MRAGAGIAASIKGRRGTFFSGDILATCAGAGPSITLTTAQPNAVAPIHKWYQIPESYSSELVLGILSRFGIKRGQTVLDPFGGAGTTAVAAQLAGINAVSIEVNPFLSFAARVKTNRDYNPKALRHTLQRVLARATCVKPIQVQPPLMPRLDKWMSPNVVSKVLTLKHAVTASTASGSGRDFFRLALAAVLRPVGNLKLTAHAFGSVFIKHDAPVLQLFERKATQMIEDVEALGDPRGRRGNVAIITGDARDASSYVGDLLPAHLAISSPPYLNNLDYTMQTRLELFFLDFVRDLKDVRTLRKQMMICDAKAMYRDIQDMQFVAGFESINKVARAIEKKHAGKRWGWDYPFMVRQYFGGLYRVLEVAKPHLSSGARFVIVIGESAHSGIKAPVPDIVAELGDALGYIVEEIVPHRERRSSSHSFSLREASVILRKK